ncbi:hypothetical protein BKE38_05815 [Pseudoroseomonas deserti]|uniref:EAL domain-containing protein n=1 Tax=Teichococcus deserti TaxID=1817963 RepID=A0A1V2H7K3_9PROT|nr:EAL domain-containing protein [Pseudoroseomonas deserti]ONG56480.1 hypothetical protein BKE38_05815 [Pseudoroseomonas deserti]
MSPQPIPVPGRAQQTLLLARDPAVLRALHGVAGMPPRELSSGREALRHLFTAEDPARHLVCQPSAAGKAWPALLATAQDPFVGTGLIVVQEDARGPGVPARASDLAAALKSTPPPGPAPVTDPMVLARGLARGEISVRYQPVLRIADERPVLVEGLARWQPKGDVPLGPDSFVPLAERSGQVSALSVAVAQAAFAELGPIIGRLGASLSLNLPLSLLLDRTVPQRLCQLRDAAHFPADALMVELTETTPVRDRSALRRALHRCRALGLPVLVDDMGLQDERVALLDLPFAGIKLDRSLVAAMPESHRARAEVAMLVRRAHANRMTVTAEGISDSRLWRAVAAAGVDNAQGYAISRPLTAAALPAWASTRHWTHRNLQG